MKEFIGIISSNIVYFYVGNLGLTLIMTVIAVTALIKVSKLKKRINRFLLPDSERHNIEEMLNEYLDKVQWMSDQHDQIINHINNINGRMKNCVQKVGIIRYNPFDDVGGDLCFAVAFLNEKNDGTVLNSIYSREGCYTYCKPIKNGICDEYKLSAEEEEAIKRAVDGRIIGDRNEI